MDKLKFLADTMLGSLAKKLRLLGVDTTYISDADHSQLKYLVRFQGRILLTRDNNLSEKLGDLAWLVSGNNTRKEFLSIADKLSTAGCQPEPLSRCLECNDMLATVDPVEMREKVPPYIIESRDTFSGCPSCGRVYWEGTHSEQMVKEVEWMRGVIQGEGRLD